jgi:hypothetical protein
MRLVVHEEIQVGLGDARMARQIRLSRDKTARALRNGYGAASASAGNTGEWELNCS